MTRIVDPGQTAGGSAVDEAAQALGSLKAPGEAAASSISTAFDEAATHLATSLANAAASGKLSLADLGKAALSAINSFEQAILSGSGAGAGGAGNSGGGANPITGLASALGAALGGNGGADPFGGARADGGDVSAGQSYIVGERGPEVFHPGVSGAVDATSSGASGGVIVNLTLQAPDGGPGLFRSETQIAQALARATALGVR